MLDFQQSVRIARLQERVVRSTLHELRKDYLHKSSEAAVSVGFHLPNMFEREHDPFWTVRVYSYVLGPHRTHTFNGLSLNEAISKAEDAVEKWCFGSEMEMLEAQLTLTDDEADRRREEASGDDFDPDDPFASKVEA